MAPGLVHDEVTRSVAAKVCLSGQRWQTAVTLLSLGEGPVDVATSTTAMAAFSDGFAWKVAFHLLFKGLLGKCFERGWAALHTAAVTMCGRHIQWRGAVALLQKFVDRRCDVSVDTCSAALKACADGEQWQGSVSLLFCMDQLHLQPDALSFSPVISACRNWQLGLLLFHNMVSRQLKPNVITCNAVLSMLRGVWTLAASHTSPYQAPRGEYRARHDELQFGSRCMHQSKEVESCCCALLADGENSCARKRDDLQPPDRAERDVILRFQVLRLAPRCWNSKLDSAVRPRGEPVSKEGLQCLCFSQFYRNPDSLPEL